MTNHTQLKYQLAEELALLTGQLQALMDLAKRLQDELEADVKAETQATAEKPPSGDPGEPQPAPKFGEVRYFPAMSDVPPGWVMARGQAVKVDDYVMISPELKRQHPFVRLIKDLEAMILPAMAPDPATGHLPHIYLGPRVARPAPQFKPGDIVRFSHGSTAFGIVRDVNWHGGHGTYALRCNHVLASISQPIDVLETQVREILASERDWLRLMGGLRPGVKL